MIMDSDLAENNIAHIDANLLFSYESKNKIQKYIDGDVEEIKYDNNGNIDAIITNDNGDVEVIMFYDANCMSDDDRRKACVRNINAEMKTKIIDKFKQLHKIISTKLRTQCSMYTDVFNALFDEITSIYSELEFELDVMRKMIKTTTSILQKLYE